MSDVVFSPLKHQTFARYWLNVGPASQTVGQHCVCVCCAELYGATCHSLEGLISRNNISPPPLWNIFTFVCHFNSMKSIQPCSHFGALNPCHCHLRPPRYSLTPESSEACGGKVHFLRIKHRNNIPILRGENRYTYLKSCTKRGSKPQGR